MENKKDSPGVYIPPPLLYVLIFFTGVLLEKRIPINKSLFHSTVTKITGVALLGVAVVFLFTSLKTFLQSRNTLVLIKPATSLQTAGIYHISRNPMYTGLAFVYLGIACLGGNWWHIIFFPVLLMILQVYIIRREEDYLARRFGQQYLDYKSKVRRWL